MHLPLWLIFRQSHPNFINVRTAYASEIWAQLTKNLLTKSGTERFRENIGKTQMKQKGARYSLQCPFFCICNLYIRKVKEDDQ